MSILTDLLKQRDVRAMLKKAPSTLGYVNLLGSAVQVAASGAGRNGGMPRHLLPALWRNLGPRKAVVTHSGSVSFSEQADRTLRLASGFHGLGLRPGEHAAVLLHNEQAWFDTLLACLLSGYKMPMLNTHLKPDELMKCISSCRPKILVFSAGFLELMKEIEPKLDSAPVFICAGAGDLPDHYLSLESVIQNAKPELPPGLSGGLGLPQMPFSGGSTGVPKFVTERGAIREANPRMKGMNPASVKALQAEFINGLARLGLWSIPGTIVSMIPGPLYHAGPQTAVLPLLFGSTIVAMRKFDAEDFLRLIQIEKVSYTFVAPTMLERVLKLPDEVKEKYDLSSMRVVLCAAAPCPDYVKKDINALFRKQGARSNVFHEYYGSSEAAIITVLKPEDYEANPKRYKSVGRPSGSECRIYDPDKQRWCRTGEVGHVLVRNIRMYRVHYGNSDELEKAFIEVDGVYWYDDGCLGYFDEDGYLYLTSRSKDMIISGGVNIFPPEIEEVIKTHPNIMDVAVVKVADADLGEVPGALIQTVDGNEMPVDEVIAYCKGKGLYGFKLPRAIKFIKQLPKNDAGKIRKVELEKEFASL